MICKDCDRPLTTYQGINQRPEDAEVFCAYCEANPPKEFQRIDAADYSDFGDKFLGGELGSKFYYVEHSGEPVNTDNFAERVADKIYKDLNKPWREAPLVYLSLHTDEPEWDGTEVGDLIHPEQKSGYARQPTTFSDSRAGCNFNERRAVWTAESNWPRITHFGVYDAKTGGNLLFHSMLDREMETEEGDTFEFLEGSVKIQIT